MLHLLSVFALVSQVVTALPSTLHVRAIDARQVGYVSVSVATVWTDPSKPRPGVDEAALTSPDNVQGWLKSMTLDQFLDLTDNSRTQTQALYGNEISILSEKDGWYEVAVKGQPSPKHTAGYPGWIPKAQISLDSTYGQIQSGSPFALVNKVAHTSLYRDAQMKKPYMEVTYATRLPVIGHHGKAAQVAVPGGGSAYVSTKHATVYKSASDIPYPTGEDLLEDGKMFIGTHYLWGGASGYAFDCSGLTHTLYDAHGITIGRDADAQADFEGHGTNVDREDLQIGDLIYYASNLTNPSSIYHVAMYAGDGKMLEAHGAAIPTQIAPVRFDENYWGAQRFLTK
ncbi:hypothetical protein GX51_07140 [Blastomyces parvus]|uniref:NlpC/P60 domain-containing protein n=1 Tax=Blastomyces parvus TaxID=2060905 RepID=A0A2B7WMJ8_9EURO|nr:hypothetical protein GX51_07140 [Blastomyces parvus]